MESNKENFSEYISGLVKMLDVGDPAKRAIKTKTLDTVKSGVNLLSENKIFTLTDFLHFSTCLIYFRLKSSLNEYLDRDIDIVKDVKVVADSVGLLNKDLSLDTDTALIEAVRPLLGSNGTLKGILQNLLLRIRETFRATNKDVRLISEMLELLGSNGFLESLVKTGNRFENQNVYLANSPDHLKYKERFLILGSKEDGKGSGYEALKRISGKQEKKDKTSYPNGVSSSDEQVVSTGLFLTSKHMLHKHLIKLPTEAYTIEMIPDIFEKINQSNITEPYKKLLMRQCHNDLHLRTDCWFAKFLKILLKDLYNGKIREIVDFETQKKTGAIDVRMEIDVKGIDYLVKRYFLDSDGKEERDENGRPDWRSFYFAVDAEHILRQMFCVFILGIEDRIADNNNIFVKRLLPTPKDLKYAYNPVDLNRQSGPEHLERILEFVKIISKWNLDSGKSLDFPRLIYLMLESTYADCYTQGFVRDGENIREKRPYRNRNFTSSETYSMSGNLIVKVVTGAMNYISPGHFFEIISGCLTPESLLEIKALHQGFMEDCQLTQLDSNGKPLNYNVLEGAEQMLIGIQECAKRCTKPVIKIAAPVPKPVVPSATPKSVQSLFLLRDLRSDGRAKINADSRAQANTPVAPRVANTWDVPSPKNTLVSSNKKDRELIRFLNIRGI